MYEKRGVLFMTEKEIKVKIKESKRRKPFFREVWCFVVVVGETPKFIHLSSSITVNLNTGKSYFTYEIRETAGLALSYNDLSAADTSYGWDRCTM